METKYNGWTNYATWRISLEWFDGDSIQGDADYLREYVEESLELNCENEIALSYALAFLDDVNWNEIAESLENGKIEELIYEFNNMDKMPIIEINLGDYIDGMDGEYEVYNLIVNSAGICTDTGLSIDWDVSMDLDEHLEALMEEITTNIMNRE